MAYTREFFYTHEVAVEWDSIYSEADISQADIEGEYTDLVPNFLTVHQESLTATPKPWNIQKGYKVWYRLRFYKKVTGASASENGTYHLDNNTIQNIEITLPNEYKDKVKLGKVQTRNSYSPLSRIDPKNNDGSVFIFTIEPKENSFNISKPFTVTCDITAGNPNAQTASQKGKFPLLKVTAARAVPPVPDSFLDALKKEGNYTSNPKLEVPQDYPYVYDHCSKTWIGLNIGFLNTTDTGLQYYTKITSDLKGKKVKIGEKTKVKGQLIGTSIEEGWALRSARRDLSQLLVKQCGGAGTTGNGTGEEETPVDVPPNPPTRALRWNPPTHMSSRSLPFGMLMDPVYGDTREKVPLSKAKIAELNGLYGAMDNSLQRGKIFQDTAGAAALNQNAKNGYKVPNDTGLKIWGFRFMYNPTSFSYSTSSNNSVDWTLGSKDPGILLSGNQNVTFEIYINRIADMGYLAARRAGHPVMDLNTAYPPVGLEKEQIEGLLHRGTEYDIEYLYRVLNGNPIKSPLLFSTDYDGASSDFGYTTGMPCWLHLNDNLRYYGSISNFQVNHAMFTVNMVPMLSTVSITFSRYPALWGSTNEAAVAAGVTSQDALKKKLVSTGETPKP